MEFLNLEISESPTKKWINNRKYENLFKKFNDLDDDGDNMPNINKCFNLYKL